MFFWLARLWISYTRFPCLIICIRPWPSGDHFFRDIKCVQCNFLGFGIGDLLGLLQRLKCRLENGGEHRNTAFVWELMLRSSRGLQPAWELNALPPSCPPYPWEMPLRTPPPPPQTVTRSVVAEPEYAALFLLGLASAIHRGCVSQELSREREPIGDTCEEIYCKELTLAIVGPGQASQKLQGPRSGKQWELSGVSRASALFLRPFNWWNQAHTGYLE